MIYEYLSPAGVLSLAFSMGKLCLCDWRVSAKYNKHLSSVAGEVAPAIRHIDDLKKQLDEFFDGNRRSFRVSLAPNGTAFQRKVWNALLGIPYGSTMTYGELAAAIGMPQAVRAVASAVAANPISIIIPCHRIVGAHGAGGYAGGAEAKRFLLSLESAH